MTILSMYTEAAWIDEALPEISYTYLATHTEDLSQSLKLGLNFILAVTYVSTCVQHDAVQQEIDKADLWSFLKSVATVKVILLFGRSGEQDFPLIM